MCIAQSQLVKQKPGISFILFRSVKAVEGSFERHAFPPLKVIANLQ